MHRIQNATASVRNSPCKALVGGKIIWISRGTEFSADYKYYGIVLGDLTICSMLRIASFSCTILLPALPALLIPSSQPGQKSQNTQNLFVISPTNCPLLIRRARNWMPKEWNTSLHKDWKHTFWSSSRILKSSKFVDVGFEYITSSDRWKMEGL